MHRTLTTLTTAAVLAAGAAGVAGAATSGPAKTVARAGEPTPVTVPGTGLKKGMDLKAGQVLISRTVTVTGDEQPRTKVTCPGAKRLKGLATQDGDDLAFKVADRRSYVAKRAVTVQAYARDADGTEPVSGPIYALCGR